MPEVTRMRRLLEFHSRRAQRSEPPIGRTKTGFRFNERKVQLTLVEVSVKSLMRIAASKKDQMWPQRTITPHRANTDIRGKVSAGM